MQKTLGRGRRGPPSLMDDDARCAGHPDIFPATGLRLPVQYTREVGQCPRKLAAEFIGTALAGRWVGARSAWRWPPSFPQQRASDFCRGGIGLWLRPCWPSAGAHRPYLRDVISIPRCRWDCGRAESLSGVGARRLHRGPGAGGGVVGAGIPAFDRRRP